MRRLLARLTAALAGLPDPPWEQVAEYPQVDSDVLHAPGTCRACDRRWLGR